MQRSNQFGQLSQALNGEAMGQRGTPTIGPHGGQRHPTGRASLTDHHPLGARPGLLEEDRQTSASQRMERMSNNDRVRNWA